MWLTQSKNSEKEWSELIKVNDQSVVFQIVLPVLKTMLISQLITILMMNGVMDTLKDRHD